MQRSLLGMVDVAIQTLRGVRLGTIRDAWLDPGEHRLVSFQVAWDDAQVLVHGEPLPVQDLLELTPEVATVEDEIGTCRGLDMHPPGDDGPLLLARATVVGMWIEDEASHLLGCISDVLFDPRDGSVQAYEYIPGEDPEAVLDTRLIVPGRGMRFDDGRALIVPAGTRAQRPPRLDVVMLTDLGLEEPLGDEDVEVLRGQPMAEP
ncbi:MAG: hypothetical protein VKQ33_14685 [Candidatus Sericytochromatia bacterium]|nr:hypothetical protein [Candidatus Sericytochromatia bacterium]